VTAAAAEVGDAEPAQHPVAVQASPEFSRRIRDSGLSLDAAQQAAVETLSRPSRRGYYLWGPVGRGKTVLAEEYLAAVPEGTARRFHFHGFFRDLQREIFGSGATLSVAIGRLMGPARAVLFDEFHVHDVADAVYLTAVLRWLQDERVLLLATSNYAPADLLPDPLHHHRFLPAIALIEEQLTVVPLGAGTDYRVDPQRAVVGFAAGTWRVGASDAAVAGPVVLDAGGIPLRTVSVDEERAVLTFEQLCEQPVGAGQYLWLADQFRRVAVLDVPDPARIRREPLLRLGILVDILHDRDVTLDVTAGGAPERVLDAAAPPRDAARAVSRLSLLRRA
jgi:cell division protein ZapE